MTQLLHDIVVSAVRRVVCRGSFPSSLEPSYKRLQSSAQPPPKLQDAPQAAPARAQAQQQESPGQRRGDILAVMPCGQIDIIDVTVVHTSRKDCLNGASRRAGVAAKKGEDVKLNEFKKFEDAGQYNFVPFALESYGRLGAKAQNFLKKLGEIAGGRGGISKSAFVRSAYREVSCALQRGIGLMYARSTLSIARASGRQFMPGCVVPVQDEALV